MLSIARIALFVAVLAALVPVAATAAPRMPIGFQDDPTFRWLDGAPEALDLVAEANASLVRAQVNWSASVPRRPANATNPFDPAYQLQDLDDMIRNAQSRGMEVMLAIWGTPKWANGGQAPNVPPRRLADLTNFARALAARYSGRYPGYPAVRYYGVWNEPNLEIFLTPQFNAAGKIVSPGTYARMYKAAYAGIKRGNRNALVAIGETSNRGRDKPSPGNVGDSVAPATFARLLAQTKGLRFDAYATHPYATSWKVPPTQRVRWPNVTLTQLDRFGDELDGWFKRKNIPLWITEYGYEVNPPEPFGTTRAKQAAYLRIALNRLKADPRVQMFIWFVFKDSRQALWQSGMLTQSGARRPAYATFSALAAATRGQTLNIAARRAPRVEVALPKFASVTEPGRLIGIDWRVFDGRRRVAIGQAAAPLTASGTAVFVPNFVPVAGKTYTLEMDANDPSGNQVSWTYALVTASARR